MSVLTLAQGKVLDFIVMHIQEHQRPPTRAEISREFGWSSPNAAQDHVARLARKGYVRLYGCARGIELTGKAEAA